MTLRNAFEDLSTESMLRKILRAVSFAKDSQDRMYVTVANVSPVNIYAGNSSTLQSGQVVPIWSAQSWNAHDIRQEYAEITHQSFQATRSRWTIT